ncbi:hypothetical protein [Gloeobacter kilaueensis]|uniref:Uncharacterized protein n=1 Tax=Gloeobacter kilaueensis (strain ATCC BAA-2537 / CCAP 1431/1 / ULC 316 / JS1) TaxID=1183438 RepID=U5QR12_GLOK1|nr:hypothetical protein [Gloeobacter kilaueensis]AGY60094.1 hypothetical protein GKIL_3848 [Gloeobacter kilaueensis JS1]
MAPRILVIGNEVATVQKVSRFCLAWSADVLPMYGPLTAAAVEPFAPDLIVVCLPYPDLPALEQPCLYWSEAGGSRADLDNQLRPYF